MAAPSRGVDLRILSRDIATVGAAVRAAGSDRTIVNEMAKEIRAAARPLRPEIRANAAAVLPRRGGLGALVAKVGVRVSVKRGTRSAGVSLTGTKKAHTQKRDLRAIDDGFVRVPTKWNNRKAPWRVQAVRESFMTEVVMNHRDQFREAIVVAVDRAMRRVGL